MDFADIVLPLPLDQFFTYQIPEGMSVSPGTRVKIPFGKQKEAVGFVVQIHSHQPNYKTKTIEALLDREPILSPYFIEWLQWASRYYLTPLGEVLSTALPAPLLEPHSHEKLSLKKTRLSPMADHWLNQKKVILNQDQQVVLNSLRLSIEKGEPKAALLHGVTGSGKTEIYLQLIEHLISLGKQAILLVPEIGLTPQMVSRTQHYFGDQLALYHSGLTQNQRLKEWMRAKEGKAHVVVGTRSALFMPFENLGIIIIDEEHDGSYKQDERFRYHARDLAIVRGQIQKCLVLIGSATPSLESFQNARDGKYQLFSLHNRAAEAKLPQIQLIDMGVERRQTKIPLSLCRELHQAIEETLQKKEQVLLLLNRRGFARSSFCFACQQSIVCPNCSVNLRYHKNSKILLCHYCDYSIPLPSQCPSCQSREMTLLGDGTETIEEELTTYFPAARVARLDRDTTQKKGALLKILKDLKEGSIDILVGTQMIAKGHDISRVTLVGVMGIDGGLGLPDFRASEKTFQLLTQVAGRAGRADKKGKVLVQTYSPEHYSIQAAYQNNFNSFFEKEIGFRKELGYPPFGRLIQFRFSSPSEQKLKIFIKRLEKELQSAKHQESFKEVQCLGPTPAPLDKLKGRFRWHLILKGKKVSALKQAASKLLLLKDKIDIPTVKWAIDVDPISML